MKTSYKKHVRTTLKAIGGKRRRNTRRFARKTYRKFYGGKKLRRGGTRDNTPNHSHTDYHSREFLNHYVNKGKLGVGCINGFPSSTPNGLPNHNVPLNSTVDEYLPFLLPTRRYPELGEHPTPSRVQILKNAERIAAENKEAENKEAERIAAERIAAENKKAERLAAENKNTSRRKRKRPQRYGK